MEEWKYRTIAFIKQYKLPLLIVGGGIVIIGIVFTVYFMFLAPKWSKPVASPEIAAALSGQNTEVVAEEEYSNIEEFERYAQQGEPEAPIAIEEPTPTPVEEQVTDETVYEIEEVEPTAEDLAAMATPAPEPEKESVDLIMFMGSSNMSGFGGDKNLAPSVSVSEGLEFKAHSAPTKLLEISEPFGKNEEADDIKNGSLVSAFIKKYHERCGRKVIAVSNSKCNTSITYWTDPQVMTDSKDRYEKAAAYLNDHNYLIGHKYIVWLQGENDFQMPADEYGSNLIKVMNNLIDAGAEQVFVITPGRALNNPHVFDTMVLAQQTICETDSFFTLGSSMLYTLDPATSMVDLLNYNQDALNKAGEEAGFIAGGYTNKHVSAVDL